MRRPRRAAAGRRGEDVLGCIALKPLVPPQMWPRSSGFMCVPQGRGLGVGKALIAAMIAAAEDMRLQRAQARYLPHLEGRHRALRARTASRPSPLMAAIPIPGWCAWGNCAVDQVALRGK
jgi:GNAT superfamily N-acetyltransferase